MTAPSKGMNLPEFLALCNAWHATCFKRSKKLVDKSGPTVESGGNMSKNKAAVDLGRRGGLAGTPAQTAARKRNAKIAGLARLKLKKPKVSTRLVPATA